MGRANDVMRFLTIAALLVGAGLFLAPVDRDVAGLALPESPAMPALPTGARADADSLAEDIILHNLFSASRTAPTRRYAGPGSIVATDESSGEPSMARSSFSPALVGTAISDQPGASKALLQLDPADLTPRLFAVGEGAGGYRVVSIDARSVQLAGPRGRVVLRLPQDREDNQ